ncbi:hypothetical protein N431DRAFT_426626 [Stipitochalara longipes BDJ]|nr:hypothetical protein N431DRAFT_426626 [Stipitochalara longipes BDJ]
MRKSTPDFEIHVDGSCMTDPASTDHDKENEMSQERVSSNQTVVHHDSWSEADPVEEEPAAEELVKEEKPAEKEEAYTAEEAADENHDEEQAARERQIDRIEAQIQAAARAVVASIEQDHYGGPADSELSMRTDESYQPEGTELTYDGTELTYDGTEASFQSDHEQHSEHSEHEGHSEHEEHLEHEEHPEHEENWTSHDGAMPDSEHIQKSEDEAAENSHHEPADESDHDQHSEHEEEDSSSHHDGDIDDDVFSHSDASKRSSLNSLHELSADENIKLLTSPALGEEAASSSENEPISRIPSGASYMHPPADSDPRTPSKVLSRPPFRTPSSVRAIQMSSPTPSIFSSPRSTKRGFPTVSRIGTPNSHNSPSKRTPTRFKPKPLPLVLLHVTVLPLQWPYSHLMSVPDFPEALHNVKESWRLLQEKLGDTVLERGILLPHPQDSYEVLEERLLEALELPVRPRALILKCGHYMGPSETPSSDEEGGGAGDYSWNIAAGQRKWCDICRRDVRVEETGDVAEGERRFRVKIYASNGLMRAGAWEAAWREMERVDVEIEPFVEGALAVELEHLATISPSKIPPAEEHLEVDDGFVDEEDIIEHVHEHVHEHHEPHVEPVQEEDEVSRLKRLQNEERMREIYGPGLDTPCPPRHPPRPRPERRSNSRGPVETVNGDSLPDLLLAAFKVAMRDRKNVAIVALSLFILILSLRPSSVQKPPSAVVLESQPVLTIETTTVFREATVTEMVHIPVVTSIMAPVEIPTMAAQPIEVVKSVESKVPVVEIPTVQPVPAQETVIPVVENPDSRLLPAQESVVPVVEVLDTQLIPAQENGTPVIEIPATQSIPAYEPVVPVVEAPLPTQEPEQKVISPSVDIPSVEVEVPLEVPVTAETQNEKPVSIPDASEAAA